MSLLGEELK